jgi:hypothetical protein
MAKLKCLKRDAGGANPLIEPQGYIDVTKKLIMDKGNFYEFVSADPDERPGILQGYAGKDAYGKFLVEHVYFDQYGVEKSEVIDNDNCEIVAQKDRRKKGNKKPSRVTMPIPPEYVPNVSYLDEYIIQIHAYWDEYKNQYPTQNCTTAKSAGEIAADKDNARQFLFGIMLLTRCR